MNARNLTKWEQGRCSEFLDWLVNSVAPSITTPKRGRKPSPRLIDNQLTAMYGQMWEFYRKTGILGFADATEAFRKAWIQWRMEVGVHPMRRMKLYGSQWRPVGKPFIPARHRPSDKKARSVWIGSRLWLASVVSAALYMKSSYSLVMSKLMRCNAHVTAVAIKVRVCEFRKAQSPYELAYIARNLFDEFKRTKFRDRHPKKLPQIRAVGLHLTMATDRELELLDKLTGKSERAAKRGMQNRPVLEWTSPSQ